MSLVSTVKTVVQVTANLDESRRIYEEGIGLKCIGETVASVADIGAIWGVAEAGYRVARFAREGEEFGCIDLVENSKASAPIRDNHRAFDFGIMTLNFRTNNIENAIPKLLALGCEMVSEILEYNAGKPMREVMMNTPSGERLTILEVGGVNDDLPIFNEAIATVGFVVPKMEEAKRFYEDGFGLQTAIAFQASGSPFDALLGVKQLDKLDFATLTAGGNWTGKVELLELAVPGETAVNTNELTDLKHTGYTFVTFLSNDIGKVAESCRQVGAEIIVEPKTFNRPFHTGKQAMIVRALSGEYLEIIEA